MQSEINLIFDIDPQLRSFFLANPQFAAALDNVRDRKKYIRYRLYAENNFAVSERLFFNPGIRLDYYDVLQKTYLSPRLSLSYALDDITTLRAVWGMYYQSPGYEKVLDQSALLDLKNEFTRDLNAENAYIMFSGLKDGYQMNGISGLKDIIKISEI
jgi:outer membrane receptor protein involved in Fe transport